MTNPKRLAVSFWQAAKPKCEPQPMERRALDIGRTAS